MRQSPLAYLLGLEGAALLRSFTEDGHGREFVDARICEIRRLLADETLADAAVDVARVGTVDGYRIWSTTYDGPNSAFDLDEPLVREILDGLPPGAPWTRPAALDASRPCSPSAVAASSASTAQPTC